MKVSEFIFDQVKKGNLDAATGKELLEEVMPDDIAIVGISCEYTNVKDTFEFYNAVKNGKRGFKTFPEDRVSYIPKDHSYLHNGAAHLKTTKEDFLDRLCQEKGAYLEDIDAFDPQFFGISHEEAKYIDPTHRLVMKHSYLAIEDAGIRLDKIKDSKTAIYIGKDKSITANYRSEIEEDSNYVNSGCWEGILASRLNYIYNLSGGSFVIDTACSSSLVAAHIAMKTLRDKEIDTALVGGIALGLFPRQGGVIDQYSNVETSRSFLKVFDVESSGTIFGEGVGIIVMKRLKDAIADNDNIYSVIRGSMINSDGKSNGLTAPNPHAQKDLLLAAYERSQISPETVEYIDAHGTGTKLGDPIEVRGLTDAYKKFVDKKGFCALTSLKENIGHTVGAAGVGGLIKMSLALRNKEIFPNQSFEAPNEYIKFVDSPFYIPTKAKRWEKGKYPRRGGISSFGFSGTNAHVILEEYDYQQESVAVDQAYPFVFTAQSQEQLVKVLKKFVAHASYMQHYNLRDISYTLVHKRNHFQEGVGFQANSKEEYVGKLVEAIRSLEQGEAIEGIYSGEIQSISSDLKKMMQHRLKTSQDGFTLNERIQLYLDGYDQAFDAIEYGKAVTQSLPTYEFKKEILWANVKKYAANNNNVGLSLPLPLTLIKQQTLKTENSDVYAVTLSPQDWYVDDHRIGGKRTFSGTTYTEIAAELASLYFKSPSFTIEKLYFMNLIQLDEKSKRFFIQVNKLASKQLDVEVFSYENDDLDHYVKHATFTMVAANESTVAKVDVTTEFEAFLQEQASLGGETNNFFKGRWQFEKHNFRLAQNSKNEMLLSLSLSEEFLHDLNDFYLHPSILDGIMGAMVFERAISRSKAYLPLSYFKFTYTGLKFTKTVYSKTEFLYDPDRDHDVITAKVSVYNEQGDLIAYVDKYMMKAFANIYFKPYLHQVKWEKAANQPNLKVNLAEALSGLKVLLIGNKVAATYATSEEVAVHVVDYREVLHTTLEDKYDFVLYAPWLGEALPPSEEIEQHMLQYFNFAKNANKWVKRNGKVVVIADNGAKLDSSETVVNPLNYSLLSAGRILGMENTGFKTLTLNVDDFQLDTVLGLALTEELDGKKLLYSNDTLYEEALVEVKELEADPIELADSDCVVVTGGYGGIGLEYVDQLLDLNPNVHIAILGRTDALAVLSNKQSLTDIEQKKLEKIKSIKEKGANVEFYPCDIASEDHVRRVLGTLSTARPITGIVHLAGVPEEGMLFAKTEQQFMSIVSPKVTGTVLLNKYAASSSLKFFVTSSSMTTIVGSAGQFSYTFANAFLEGAALADSRVRTIQWPGWNDTGMALGFGDLAAADEHLLMKSLSSLVGRQYIKLSLEKNVSRLIVGEFNSAKVTDYLADYIRLPQQFISSNKSADAGLATDEAAPYAIKSYEQLTITGTDSQDEVEMFISVVFASVLDRNELDVNKSFTDLGGDSLKAFGIYAPIAEHFKIDIEVADVFIYPTITQLSEYVKELLEEKNG
ncbi:SDR family NAD(P)-dependent oxidoreductase [Paenibacillus sp. N1-5-1-14]|uniref:SDR family NAD(P)-dependent oxidoreductase n=1 Tax=Paenibacillus radicibacter TaxID=2972488 RepID=UPI0021593273|nr:SDR family NAD(P)-dependent oxidoreductase [Paenibacillus radicibacter]MCR8644644.1 SDR family NAD(P)-dependent oxidoreductase [Paenibacillus radicibacter]